MREFQLKRVFSSRIVCFSIEFEGILHLLKLICILFSKCLRLFDIFSKCVRIVCFIFNLDVFRQKINGPVWALNIIFTESFSEGRPSKSTAAGLPAGRFDPPGPGFLIQIVDRLWISFTIEIRQNDWAKTSKIALKTPPFFCDFLSKITKQRGGVFDLRFWCFFGAVYYGNPR